jgi:beta-phosphoglucomutase
VIRAIVFDCDGVLADTEPLHMRGLNRVLAPHGVSLDRAAYAALVGLPDPEALRRALAGAGKTLDAATLDALARSKSEEVRAVLRSGVVPIPGVREFVRAAAARYPLAVASGAWRAEVEAVLEGLGIADCFRVVVALEDCPRGKPDPAPFLEALARLNASSPAPEPPLQARDCLVIEDAEHGIVAARAAGMRSVGLSTTHTPDTLRDADLVANNFRGLDLGRMTAFFDRRARG